MLILDNNLSPRLIAELRDTYVGILHVCDVGLDDKSDIEIWQFAEKHKLHVVTKDKDFKNIQAVRGWPPKIVWLRLGNVPSSKILKVLLNNEKEIRSFLSSDSSGTLQIRI